MSRPVTTLSTILIAPHYLTALCLTALCLTALCLTALPAAAQFAPAEGAPPLDDATRSAIVDAISADIDRIYVFPDVGTKMIEHIRAELAAGAYSKLERLPELTAKLTEDLQSISHDRHLHVDPMSPGLVTSEQEVDQEEMQRRHLESSRRSNYGFQRLDRLAGNVGYLDLRGFSPASIGGTTAVAAMRFLSTADAVIIDLRQNGGGSPSMIQLISSYFFAEPTHLNSFYVRQSDSTQQFWSHAHVEGPRMVETPLYVLTSGRTFSAAEEFTYNMRNLERATIIGETTGGGAHPVDGHSYPELSVRMSLPFGRAVNPITGTNWEGTGVEPHVQVPATEALTVAHAEALEKIAASATDEDHKAGLAWALEGLVAQRETVTLTAARLADYVGLYGPRKIRVEDGKLLYQRGDGPVYELIPMGEDAFRIAELDYFRIRFDRDRQGKVVTLMGRYNNGREEPSTRTEG